MPHQSHPEWEAFLAAIVAEPDDDTPRLVAADWLDEHDRPAQAAFVRVQVELARLEATGRMYGPEADSLRVKERAALGPWATDRSLWAAEACPQLVRVTAPPGTKSLAVGVTGGERVRFHRGFVEEVIVTAAKWLQHGAAVRARNPIRRVLLSRCDDITRDHWYQMMTAGGLYGLDEVVLDTRDGGLVDFLRAFLTGTAVEVY